MLRALLRWIRTLLFGVRVQPNPGEYWVFREDPQYFLPVIVMRCDGKTVWYDFATGRRATLDVRRFVAWYRRAG